MPFVVPVAEAEAQFPEFAFVKPLTPSAHKAAFHVRDKEGHDLCLKIISPDYGVDRLGREIKALQQTNHPNVVKLIKYVYSSGQDEQQHYLVEEFVEGKDLSEHLGQPWGRSRVAAFFGQLLDGLAALNKIVHRDIKPANIRVRPNDSPVLIDFGLARLLDLPDLTATADGAQIGTRIYFSPEQFRGTKHDIDNRTDLFAVGILIYQALVGHHPFYKPPMTLLQLEGAACDSSGHFAVDAFRSLPGPWRTFVSKMLATDRVRRPLNAAQAAHVLQKIASK